MTDTLANVLNTMKVAEIRGKQDTLVRPASKMIRSVLEILKEEGYIDEFELLNNGLDGEFSVKLSGKINACGAVKPRFPVKTSDWEKYESRFLPAKGMGILLVSTSKGIVTHQKAKEQNAGGRLIAYVY